MRREHGVAFRSHAEEERVYTMGERSGAMIYIGGSVSTAQAEEIARLAQKECLFGYGLDAHDEPVIVYVKEVSDLLRVFEYERLLLLGDDLSWGEMEELEEFLVEQKIPFHRTTKASGELLEVRKTFDPTQGINEPVYERLLDGQPAVEKRSLKRVLEMLERGNNPQAVKKELRELATTPKNIPPFSII